jgi:hypothetical protein
MRLLLCAAAQIVLLALASSPAQASEPDAFAEWAKGSGIAADLPWRALTEPTAHIPASSLSAAAEAEHALDEKVAQLRRGLARTGCSAADAETGRAPRLFSLAREVISRALLGAQRGEDVSPLAIDLLAFGRRAVRCQGGVLLFQVGVGIEAKAGLLIRWGQEFGQWDAQAMKRIAVAVASDPISSADLQVAVDNELAVALARVPQVAQASSLYSTQDTQQLLRKQFARLRAAAGVAQPDFAALGREVELLLSADDRAFLDAMQAGAEGKAVPNKPLSPPKDTNVVGRRLVQALLPEMRFVLEARATVDANSTVWGAIAAAPLAKPVGQAEDELDRRSCAGQAAPARAAGALRRD